MEMNRIEIVKAALATNNDNKYFQHPAQVLSDLNTFNTCIEGVEATKLHTQVISVGLENKTMVVEYIIKVDETILGFTYRITDTGDEERYSYEYETWCEYEEFVFIKKAKK